MIDGVLVSVFYLFFCPAHKGPVPPKRGAPAAVPCDSRAS